MLRSRSAAALSLGVLLLTIGVFATSSGCDGDKAETSADTTPSSRIRVLTVLTPHNEHIRDTFATGFSLWYSRQHDDAAHIRWISRGTPQCVQYMRSLSGLLSSGAAREVPDVMFGGGLTDHALLAKERLARGVDLSAALEGIPAEVNGIPTRDNNGYWFVTGLSSFGIVYNAHACEQRGIAPPQTWSDLADPRFYGWMALVDPIASGSNRECMVLMLREKGWEQGWNELMRVLANARALSDRSGGALAQVQSGVSLAALAVNFDGMSMAAESGGTLAYVDPPGATVLSPDVLSVLFSVTDFDLAKEFARYVLSDEGQALWGVARENRDTFGYTLYHYPIRPSLYTEQADKLAVSGKALEADFGLKPDAEVSASYGAALKALVGAACGDNHIALQQAWRAVIDAGMPADAVAVLCAPPADEATALAIGEQFESATPEEAVAMHKEWSQKFAARYARVLEMVGQ